jgi:succinate dehydrogenase / fumarate reductase, iron-sulfur subunit
MSEELCLRRWRGDAAGGEMVGYTVVVEPGEVVLDALHRLQATQAGDLAVRWNCKAGKCGSCSAEVNGRPKLLRMTRLSTLPAGPVTVTPLRAYPVIRDLVADISANYRKAETNPSFTPPAGLAAGDYRMAQVDVGRSQEFRTCIKCWMCRDVCHVIRDHEDNKPAYSGPRFLIRHAELDMHALVTVDRRNVVREHGGLGLCNVTKCCTEVCPGGITITDNAIIPMKEQVVDQRYDPLRVLMPRWRRRPGPQHPGDHRGSSRFAAPRNRRSVGGRCWPMPRCCSACPATPRSDWPTRNGPGTGCAGCRPPRGAPASRCRPPA